MDKFMHVPLFVQKCGIRVASACTYLVQAREAALGVQRRDRLHRRQPVRVLVRVRVRVGVRVRLRVRLRVRVRVRVSIVDSPFACWVRARVRVRVSVSVRVWGRGRVSHLG